MVKAKTLFQFYNSSLALQPVPRYHRHYLHVDKIDKPEARDVFDVMADLTERDPRLRFPSLAEANMEHRDENVIPNAPVHVTPPIVQEFIKNFEMEMFQRGILPCLTTRQRIMSPLIDSRHRLRQRPRTNQQSGFLFD